MSDRVDQRKLQDRAIAGMVKMYPNQDIEDRPIVRYGPTVAKCRLYLYPDIRWCFTEWIEEARQAGHKV